MRALLDRDPMGWTLPQAITSIVSVVALILSLANFVLARNKTRSDERRQQRSDDLQVMQLLDDAYEYLYGSEGYSSNRDKKKFDDADARIEMALKLNPQHPHAVEYKGHLFEEEGNLGAAKEHYLRSIALDAKRARPFNCLGLISEGSEAQDYFRKAIELEPHEAAIPYCNLGIAYAKAGQLQEAEASFGNSIRLRPRYSRAHYRLAELLNKLRRHDEAKKEYELAISSDPQNLSAIVSLGAFLMGRGHDEEGLAWMSHARKLKPLDYYPVAMLAAIYADRGQPAEALAYAKEAIEMDPSQRFDGQTIADLRKAMVALMKSHDSERGEGEQAQ